MDKYLALAAKQNLIHTAIRQRAIDLGFNPEVIEPIYDGVCNIKRYLDSPIRVMWILKEPYDDFDEKGKPCGGGWDIFADWENDNELRRVTSNRSWQPIMYVLRTIYEDSRWNDIDWIRDDRETYRNYLTSCAYINISKMPAQTFSGDMSQLYSKWSDILKLQILAYSPDVIIFGNTFQYFTEESFVIKAKECKGIDGITGIQKISYGGKDNIILIDAYHPNQKTITRQEYVDSIIESIKLNSNY